MRNKQYSLTALLAFLVVFVLGAPAAFAGSEIVVSIRYLMPKGMSHAHLFLYRDDGKLLRQLTRENSGQDFNPIFSPDGKNIVFTREKPNGALEHWSIQPLGRGLTRLKNVPAWYKGAKDSPHFANIDLSRSLEATPPGPPQYGSPDSSMVITLRVLPDDPDAEINGPKHGKNFLIKDLKTIEEAEAGKLPGFEGLFSILTLTQPLEQHFLIERGMRLAFFGLHLNSTDGDTSYVLDLFGPAAKWRIVRLSPNWAIPFPLPGEPAFLTLTSVRNVRLPGSRKTIDSSYIERWDVGLHKARFARTGNAISYGASMYRPGKTPSVVTILRRN
ncbi:MAG: hypothetical protein V4671_33440 [Armatimonadota bacterium]